MEKEIKIEIGEKMSVDPRLTDLDKWVEGEVIDIYTNPFKGLIIAIKDSSGRIFFGEREYFKLA